MHQKKKQITSYGIICYNERNEIILIQRKITIGYMEFLIGKYNVKDSDYILKLFDMMTIEERDKIKNTMDFATLRNDLGLLLLNSRHYNEYTESKYKFNVLKDNNELANILSRASSEWQTPEWGLPKGRKNNDETNIECAIREFCEETNVNLNNIIVDYNIIPLEEVYVGVNNVIYKHIYYFAKYIVEEPLNTKINTCEISNIRFCNLNTAIGLIRPYYIDKIHTISKAFNILTNKYIYFDDNYCSL